MKRTDSIVKTSQGANTREDRSAATKGLTLPTCHPCTGFPKGPAVGGRSGLKKAVMALVTVGHYHRGLLVPGSRLGI